MTFGVVPEPTCSAVVEVSVMATFSTSTPGRSTVTAPMSGTDGAKRRTPRPRTTLLSERIMRARTRSLARTDEPVGSEPNHSWFAAWSWKKVPGPTSASEPTWRWATPSIQIWSGCEAIGAPAFTKPQPAAVLSAAPRVYVGDASSSVVHPSLCHRLPEAAQPVTGDEPSSQAASPGQDCTVSRLLVGMTTDSW